MQRHVYLDHASTTPIDERVREAMMPYLTEEYGNPSSLHRPGRVAHDALEEARAHVASVLHASPSEIIFTSGGTEADNLAIFGFARARRTFGKHIIVSSVEHKAILDPCHSLEQEGFDITYLPVDSFGRVSVDDVERHLRPDTILISIMYANNEVGTIQPIQEIREMLRHHTECHPIFHSDACQAAGTLSLDVESLGVDALTLSASKLYGPKGIGVLYVNKKHSLVPLLLGGGQERGLRSGTENVASAVGMAHALSCADARKEEDSKRIATLRDYCILELQKSIPDIVVNGSMEHRLPNNVNISVKGVEGESLLLLLDEQGVYCSTGSACSSSDLSPSHVLLAMGVPLPLAHCSLRLTLGRTTSRDDIDYVVEVLATSVATLRALTPPLSE